MPSIINATTSTGLVTTADNSGSLQLATNSGTTAMTITTAQNVGIGIAGPSAKLHTFQSGNQDSTVQFEAGTAGYASNLQLIANNAAGGAYNNITSIAGGSGQWRIGGGGVADTITFSTGSSYTERMRINSNGKLIVGGTSLVLNNSSSGGSFQGNQTGGGDPIFEIFNSNSTSNSDGSPTLASIKASGTVNSNARFIQFYANSGSSPMGGIVGNGSTNVQFASISDVREKTNIQPISGSLQKINALKPVEFDWIADGAHVNAGFVAQDVEQVFPEFVVENMANEGQEIRKGLTGGMTGGIVAHLVAAIQELKAELDATKAEVQALKGAQ